MKVAFFVLLAANIVAIMLFQITDEPMKWREVPQAEASKKELKNKSQIPKPPDASLLCLEWRNILSSDTNRALQALQKLKLADKATLRKEDNHAGYWNYIPPSKSLTEAQKKVNELKMMGVKEVFILQENTSWRYAISLGVFSTAEAAAKYHAQLQEKGVRSAVSGPRMRENSDSMAYLKNIDIDAANRLTDIIMMEFPESRFKIVDCQRP